MIIYSYVSLPEGRLDMISLWSLFILFYFILLHYYTWCFILRLDYHGESPQVWTLAWSQCREGSTPCVFDVHHFSWQTVEKKRYCYCMPLSTRQSTGLYDALCDRILMKTLDALASCFRTCRDAVKISFTMEPSASTQRPRRCNVSRNFLTSKPLRRPSATRSRLSVFCVEIEIIWERLGAEFLWALNKCWIQPLTSESLILASRLEPDQSTRWIVSMRTAPTTPCRGSLWSGQMRRWSFLVPNPCRWIKISGKRTSKICTSTR